MENTVSILEGHSDQEKTAYLGAIASIATADREASEEEIESLSAFCQAAGLSGPQTQEVLNSAKELSDSKLAGSLDILKNSELKYSLVADLISFAKSDSDYSDAEQKSVQQISNYLGLNEKQFSVLGQFADQTANAQATPEQLQKPGFLSSLGLADKFQSAGINGSGMLKGLLAVAAPIILSRMMSGRRNSGGMFGGNSNGGLFGGSGDGGMFGGSSGGGLFGGNSGGGGLFGGSGGGMLGGGGLGSVIGMLNGNRGFGSAGGLLGRIFGR